MSLYIIIYINKYNGLLYIKLLILIRLTYPYFDTISDLYQNKGLLSSGKIRIDFLFPMGNTILKNFPIPIGNRKWP